jgi:hypothetical protein
VEKLRRDLEKAQKEVKEGDIEKERFQAQLEMLVQELEKKQVSQRESPNQGILRTKNRLRHRESTIMGDREQETGQSKRIPHSGR